MSAPCIRNRPCGCDDVANLSVSVSQAQEPRLIFLDMHFSTLLTFRFQRPHIALQTFRFQHIISAHVTLLPLPSAPRAKSFFMPQGYTESILYGPRLSTSSSSCLLIGRDVACREYSTPVKLYAPAYIDRCCLPFAGDAAASLHSPLNQDLCVSSFSRQAWQRPPQVGAFSCHGWLRPHPQENLSGTSADHRETHLIANKSLSLPMA